MLKKSIRISILEIAHAMFSRGEVHLYSYQFEGKQEPYEIANLFIDIVGYLEDLGAHVDFQKSEYSDFEKALFGTIFKEESIPFYFSAISIDVSEMKVEGSMSSSKESFGLLNLYLLLLNGTAVSKKAIEELVGIHFSHSGFETLKREFLESTGLVIKRRSDNTYYVERDDNGGEV